MQELSTLQQLVVAALSCNLLYPTLQSLMLIYFDQSETAETAPPSHSQQIGQPQICAFLAH